MGAGTEAVARLQRDLEQLKHNRAETVAHYTSTWHEVEGLGDQIAAYDQDIEAVEYALACVKEHDDHDTTTAYLEAL